jgi:5-deoxy-D-glucuronate isomerase
LANQINCRVHQVGTWQEKVAMIRAPAQKNNSQSLAMASEENTKNREALNHHEAIENIVNKQQMMVK